MIHDKLKDFCASIVENLKRYGYPEKKVAFPLEKMYEAAYSKGLSFNKVRDALKVQGIDSRATPERVIFFPLEPGEAPSGNENTLEQALNLLKHLPAEKIAELQKMAENMDPQMLSSIREKWESMPPEQRDQLLNFANQKTSDSKS